MRLEVRQHSCKYLKIDIFGALDSLQIDGEKVSSNEWIVKSKTSQKYFPILNLTAVQEGQFTKGKN